MWNRVLHLHQDHKFLLFLGNCGVHASYRSAFSYLQVVSICCIGDGPEPGCNTGVLLHARGNVLCDDDSDNLANSCGIQSAAIVVVGSSRSGIGRHCACKAACNIYAPCIYGVCLHLCLQEVLVFLDKVTCIICGSCLRIHGLKTGSWVCICRYRRLEILWWLWLTSWSYCRSSF